MTTLARDTNNDIQVKDGKFIIVSGLNCYYDILHSAVLTIYQEMVLNSERGIPYFDTVFKSPTKILFWKDRMMKVITSFSFVQSITAFDYSVDYENKLLTYTLKVRTKDGTVTIEG
jgi:hypothetical protein